MEEENEICAMSNRELQLPNFLSADRAIKLGAAAIHVMYLEINPKPAWQPTVTSKQPIRTRYLGHMTGYHPILVHSVATLNTCGKWGRKDQN